MEDREFTIETPVGSISSDSGNHFIDIVSVVGVIGILYIGKIIMKDIIKRLWMVREINRELDGQKSLKRIIKKYLKRKTGAKNK